MLITPRLDDSLATTDEFLEGVFDILNKTGNLHNTIIFGSSDHGDDIIPIDYMLSIPMFSMQHRTSTTPNS